VVAEDLKGAGMAYSVGIVVALFTALFARLTRFDRDRAFYPTVLVVIALYYILFAVMGGSPHALRLESIQLAVFAIVAVVGFRSNLWWAVGGLAGHGIFDVVHGTLVANPGVPAWWPGFCLAADGVLAVILAWLLSREIVPARAAPTPGAAISSVE
jgi:hypothetical protein